MKGQSSRFERQVTNLIRSAVPTATADHSTIGLLGTPDLAYSGVKVAVFVDGCYWHGCSIHCRRPLAASLRARDSRVTASLKASGWEVFRVWEHEEHLAPFIADVAAAVDRRKLEQRDLIREHLSGHAVGEWCQKCEQWPHESMTASNGWCVRCDVHEKDHDDSTHYIPAQL